MEYAVTLKILTVLPTDGGHDTIECTYESIQRSADALNALDAAVEKFKAQALGPNVEIEEVSEITIRRAE